MVEILQVVDSRITVVAVVWRRSWGGGSWGVGGRRSRSILPTNARLSAATPTPLYLTSKAASSKTKPAVTSLIAYNKSVTALRRTYSSRIGRESTRNA